MYAASISILGSSTVVVKYGFTIWLSDIVAHILVHSTKFLFFSPKRKVK